jgi:hypothetical protein
VNPSQDNDRRGTSGRVAALAAVLLIVALYFGIASENRRAYASRPVTYNYYDLLAEGFMSGHLYLNLPLEPEKMLPGSDPMRYTPRDHDLSLYKGRYYLYFGAAPAVALFVPWEILTGHPLSQYWAGAFLAAAGYVFSAILLIRTRRDFFPGVSPAVLFFTLLILGLINWWPILLNRVGVWEVAISGAFCFSCLTILCIYEGIRGGGRPGWLALASVSAGLAVASRPNYLYVTSVLVVPLVYFLRAERSSPATFRKWAGRICATLGPVAGVGAVLVLYNYQRFGDPLEFGTGFMILVKPNPVHFFSIRSALFNFYLYFLAPAHFSPWFPFFNITRVPALPPGHTDIPEDMYGSLANIPILLAAAIGAWLAVPRGVISRLNAMTISLLLGFLVGGGTLVIFVGANNRYIPDVLCGLPVLAVLGIWVVEERVRAGAWAMRRSRIAWGLLAAYSAFFAFCAGIQRDEIFRQACPDAYRSLAHAFDFPSQWYDRIRGVTYGPLKLDVKFPAGKPGQNEPLVVTGWGPWSNVVYVHYVDPTHLQFAFIGPRGVVRSDPFEIDYGRDHHLVISMGGLYPPREHPFFDGIDPADAEALSNTVFASVDGVTRLHAREPSFDGVSRRPELGIPPSVLDPHWTFTGTIVPE